MSKRTLFRAIFNSIVFELGTYKTFNRARTTKLRGLEYFLISENRKKSLDKREIHEEFSAKKPNIVRKLKDFKRLFQEIYTAIMER